MLQFMGKLRTRFEEFEEKGKKLSECDHYSQDIRRVRQRNHRYDEPGTAPELTQTPVDKFRTGTFLVIIDNINAELKKRLVAYTDIAARFGFLRKLKNLPDMIKCSQAQCGFVKHILQILKPVCPMSCCSFLLF